jgi:hypothetical protein
MLLFDLMATSHVTLLVVVALWLALRSFRAVSHPYFLALLALPALRLIALPADVHGDAIRLGTLVLPPLVAMGAVLLLVDRGSLSRRRWQGKAVVAVVAVVVVAGSIGWGVHHARRVGSSPVLDTQAGRAQLAGCYRVMRGPALWSWTNRQWPPAAARFDTARWVEPPGGLPRVQNDQSVHLGKVYWGQSMIRSPDGTPGWWRPAGGQFIDVNWTHQGLGGFRGSFRLEGTDLVGSGRWFQDMVVFGLMPPKLLSVRLIRIDCATMGEVSPVGAG